MPGNYPSSVRSSRSMKTIEVVLGERFPGVTVFGLFLALAVQPPNDKTFALVSSATGKEPPHRRRKEGRCCEVAILRPEFPNDALPSFSVRRVIQRSADL